MRTPSIDVGRDVVAPAHFDVVVTITHRRTTRWRMQVGMLVFKLGGWIFGVSHTHVEFKQ